MRRSLKITGIVVGVLVALIVAAILIVPPILTKGPMPEALAAMESTATVTVVDGRPITFTPHDATTTGVIVYPGAFVEPRSYAPAAHALAEDGVFVAIVPMPLSLAILGSNRADGVIEDHPEIADWVIAGHSLGGVMAARYTSNHPDAIDGLALWASYPEDGVDLSSWNGDDHIDLRHARRPHHGRRHRGFPRTAARRYRVRRDRRREPCLLRLVRRSARRQPGDDHTRGSAAHHHRRDTRGRRRRR